MTIEVQGEVVLLSGRCGADEAEMLLAALTSGARTVDISGCEHLHAAILQLLMAARPEIVGEPAPFLAQWIVPAIDPGQDRRAEPTES